MKLLRFCSKNEIEKMKKGELEIRNDTFSNDSTSFGYCFFKGDEFYFHDMESFLQLNCFLGRVIIEVDVDASKMMKTYGDNYAVRHNSGELEFGVSIVEYSSNNPVHQDAYQRGNYREISL